LDGIDGDLRRLRARLDDAGQRLLLVRRVAFDDLHQVGDQVGAALVLVGHLGEGRVDRVLLLGNGLDAAAGAGRAQAKHQSQRAKFFGHLRHHALRFLVANWKFVGGLSQPAEPAVRTRRRDSDRVDAVISQ
jgi:hypothetical protein